MRARPPVLADVRPVAGAWRRCRRVLVWGGVGCCALGLGLYVFRVPLFGAVVRGQLRDALAMVTRCAPEDVHIGALSGSWFGAVQVDEVRVVDAGRQSHLAELRCEFLRVEYSLLGLLAGFELDDIHSVTAVGLHVVLDDDRALDVVTVSNDDAGDVRVTAVLGSLFQQRMPDIALDGSVRYASDVRALRTDFVLLADDNDAVLTCEQVFYDDYALTAALDSAPSTPSFSPPPTSSFPLAAARQIHVRRDDRQHFTILASAPLRDVQIQQGSIFCGNESIQIQLPLSVHGQELLASFESNSDTHGGTLVGAIEWAQIPAWVHHAGMAVLPQRGHTQVQAHLRIDARGQRTAHCTLEGNDLQWHINGLSLRSSGTLFYTQRHTEHTLQCSHVQIHTPQHSISIREPLVIHCTDVQNAQRWDITDTTLHIDDGRCQVTGYFDPAASNFSLAWQDINLGAVAAEFGIADLSGRSHGSAHVSGSMHMPDIDVSLELEQVIYAERLLACTAHIMQKSDGIHIEHFSLQQVNTDDQTVAVTIGQAAPTPDIDVQITGHWAQQLSLTGLRAIANGTGDVSVAVRIPEIQRLPLFQNICHTGALNLAAQMQHTADGTTAQATLDMQHVSLRCFEDLEQTDIRSQSTLTLQPDRWHLKSTISQGAESFIDADAYLIPHAHVLDTATWTHFLANPLRGLVGDVSIHNLEGKLRGSFPRIGAFNGRVHVEDNVVQFNDVQAQLGYEALHLSGSFSTDGHHIIQSAVQLRGENILLVQSPDLRVRADCSLLLSRDSDTNPMRIYGGLNITKCLYNDEFITTNRHVTDVDSQVQLFSLPRSFLGDAELAINILAEETIDIRNNMFKATASSHLFISGTGLVPQPLGIITIHQDARLSLPLSTIWLKESQLLFKVGEPFDPYLNISGHAKIQGYSLRMFLAQKMSAFSFNDIDIISNPPLNQEDAVRLLTTGTPPRSINERGNDIDTSGLVIGWAIVETMRRFFGNGDPKREQFFDSIAVEMGREVSDNGLNTIEVTVPIHNSMHFKVERDQHEEFNSDIIWRFEH